MIDIRYQPPTRQEGVKLLVLSSRFYILRLYIGSIWASISNLRPEIRIWRQYIQGVFLQRVSAGSGSVFGVGFPTHADPNNKIVVRRFAYFFPTSEFRACGFTPPPPKRWCLRAAQPAGSELHLAHDVHGRPCWPARHQVCQCCLNGTAAFKWPLCQRAASEVW